MLPVTVCICTRERPAQLCRALFSLLAQKEKCRRIMVIDNAPETDHTRTLIQEEFSGVSYICEEKEGIDFARNRGLAEASTEIVAFLDDDAVAHPEWTRALAQAFAQDAHTAVVTGRTGPLSLETEAQRLFEANGGYGRGEEPVELPADASRRRLHGRRAPLIAWAVSVGNGTNFALRSSAARAIGGFDPAFDLGRALHGGGDLDIFWRLLAAGYTLRYIPAVCVRHEHRRELAAMARQLAQHQEALIAFLAKSLSQSRGFGCIILLLFLVWRLIKPGVRLLRRSVRKEALPAGVLLGMWQGCLRGLTAYPRAQRIARERSSRKNDEVPGKQTQAA